MKGPAKVVLDAANTAFEAARSALPAAKPAGRAHVITGGIGDVLLMLPYYEAFFREFPPEALFCTQAMTLPAVRALFPSARVMPLSWKRFRYDPFYRGRVHAGRRFSLVSAEFPFDPDTLLAFGRFRADRLVAGAVRSDDAPPPLKNLEVVRNPGGHHAHMSLFGPRYFARLREICGAAGPFLFDDSPEAYRRLLRSAFPAPPPERFVKPGGRYICVSNTPTWKYRRWPQASWQRLADMLPRDVEVLHLGKGGFALAHPGYRDLSGLTTLEEAFALIWNSEMFIGADTGLLHAAYMGGTPAVCVLGEGHLGHYLPWDKFPLLRCAHLNMDCAGCGWRCRYVDLSKDETPPCLTGIKPESVIGLAKELGLV